MNENIKNIGIAVLVGALLSSGYFWLEGPTQVVEKSSFGALSSPNIPSPYLQWGGVTHWGSSKALATGSTTVCTLISPNQGTSTLTLAGIRVDTGTATAMSFELSKAGDGTTNTASTTSRFITNYTFAANAIGTLFASTTGMASTTGASSGPLNGAQGTALSTFTPNTPINFVMTNGSGAGQLAPTGQCFAEWITTY